MPALTMKFSTSTARAVDRSQLDRNFALFIGALSVWPAIWKFLLGSDFSTSVTCLSASLPSGFRSVLPGSNRILSPRRTIIRFSRISTCSLPASVRVLNCDTSLRNWAARASAWTCALRSSSMRFFADSSSPPSVPRSVSRRETVSYTHLRAHETGRNLVCRLLLEKKKCFERRDAHHATTLHEREPL